MEIETVKLFDKIEYEYLKFIGNAEFHDFAENWMKENMNEYHISCKYVSESKILRITYITYQKGINQGLYVSFLKKKEYLEKTEHSISEDKISELETLETIGERIRFFFKSLNIQALKRFCINERKNEYGYDLKGYGGFINNPDEDCSIVLHSLESDSENDE